MSGREYRFRQVSDTYTQVLQLHPNGRDLDQIGTVELIDGGWFGRHFASGTSISGPTWKGVCDAVAEEHDKE